MSKVHEAIAAILEEIPAIGKDKKNQQQGFNYRGIDDVYNVISPLMAKHGLIMAPQVIEQRREERPGKSGGTLAFVSLKIKYRLFCKDGSVLEDELCPIVVGEGMDSGDKATNKAMSIAHKYAMFQLFCIPTQELADPDADSPQMGDKKPADGPTFRPYNLREIETKLGNLPTDASKTDYLRSLAIPQGHPQRPEITAIYQASITPKEAVNA